jgi:competence protein ComEC
MPPGLLPALSILLGVASGLLLEGIPARVGLALPVLLALAGYAWCRRASGLAMAALAVGFFVAGTSLAVQARTRALHPSVRDVLDREFGGFALDGTGPAGSHDPLPSRFRLLEDASVRPGYASLRARLTAVALHGEWVPVDGGVLLNVSGESSATHASAWRAGRMMQAPVTFRRPTRYDNDGVADFERDRALGGVTLLGSVKSALLVDVLAPARAVGELAGRVRAHVRRAIATWIAPHDPVTAAIAAAVLIGDRTGLPDQTRDRLQAAGTYHVIAISGGNIAILAVTATVALLAIGIRGRGAAAVAVAVLVAYACVVTAGPSVWRATLMAVLYFAARTIDHRTGAWHTAAFALSVMMVIRPLDIADPGFILTFGATVALLEGGRRGASWLRRHKKWSWLAASVVASFTVEAALLPVSAWLFSRVTAAGLVLNLVAVPLMGIVQIAALVTTAASWLPAVAGPAGWLAHVSALGLVRSADLVTLVPWSTARVPPPSLWLVAAYYGALGACLSARRRPARVAAGLGLVVAATAVAGLVDLSRLADASRSATRLRLTMFDVGQSEALLLETPGRARLLIDAAGTPFGDGGFDVGARVLVPALWARGVRSLDAFLFTHGDPDHVGGGGVVVETLAPARIWEGIQVDGHEPTRELLEAAARRGIPVERLLAGLTFEMGGARVRVLHPPPPNWERRTVRNDDSVVLEVVYGDVAFLLTGDVGQVVERAIVPLLTPARVRILKVAHHGSRTSSSAALLEAWRPQIALISCGRGNSFGHPAPEVLARLEAAGAAVLRTDMHGQITLESDGASVTARTFTGLTVTVASPVPTRPPSPREWPPRVIDLAR